MRLHGKYTPYLFLALPVTIFLFSVLIPLGSTFYYSLFEWNGITEMEYVGLANFGRLFRDHVLRDVLINTLKYALTATVFQLGLGMLLAIMLYEIRKGGTLIRVLLFTPTVISSVATSQVFRQLLRVNPDGVVNSLLSIIGLESLKMVWLADSAITIYVVAIVDSLRFSGLNMVIFFAALASIDNEVLEAAAIDGANKIKTLLLVRLPMIRGIIINCLILLTIGTFRAFDGPMILTGGGPGHSSQVISTYMFQTAFTSLNFGYGSAIGLLIAVICILVFKILGRMTRKLD